jgi:hypothetical protein
MSGEDLKLEWAYQEEFECTQWEESPQIIYWKNLQPLAPILVPIGWISFELINMKSWFGASII